MDKPKRKNIDWGNAKYDNCSCGEFKKLVDGMCSNCHEENYAYELESYYLNKLNTTKSNKKPTIKSYKIVSKNTKEELEEEVLLLIKEGWDLLGAASFNSYTHIASSYCLGKTTEKISYRNMYIQTMVLHD